MTLLTVFEIYESIQGESTHVGRPCVFVRLAACDLRCVWCDTAYAFTGGRKMSEDDVMAEVGKFGARVVEITGGEPLLQPAVIPLMSRLIDHGYEVLLETGGHQPIDDVPDEVVAIVHVKCPGSGEAAKMRWENLEQLSPHDEVKFVLAGREDFEYAREVVRKHDLTSKATVLFSPVHGVLMPADLARWILEEKLPVRLQLQAHKYIWSPEARGV